MTLLLTLVLSALSRRLGNARILDQLPPPSGPIFSGALLTNPASEEVTGQHVSVSERSLDGSMEHADHGTSEPQCRFCLEGSDVGNRLFFPCKCKGSIRYIHQNCLQAWLSASGRNSCEVCKEVYRYEDVYPTRYASFNQFATIVLDVSTKVFLHGKYGVQMGMLGLYWIFGLFTWMGCCFDICWILIREGKIKWIGSSEFLMFLIWWWCSGIVEIFVLALVATTSISAYAILEAVKIYLLRPFKSLINLVTVVADALCSWSGTERSFSLACC